MKPITRRKFLKGTIAASATLALNGCAGIRLKGNRARYVTVTNKESFYVPQDFSGIEIHKKHELPGIAKWEGNSRYFCIVTAVNDDGSKLRRIMLPGSYHCTTNNPITDEIYLLPRRWPNAHISLDSDTLEIVSACNNTDNQDEYSPAGHGFIMPDSGLLAVTMCSKTAGQFDQISFRDPKTFKEIHHFSSYGFNLHEVRLTPDGKNFICGHYGSHLSGAAYANMSTYGSPDSKNGPGYILFPGSVTCVDIVSGKRTHLYSDIHNGQEGHAVADDMGNAYLPQSPPLIHSPADLLQRKRYEEGPSYPVKPGEYESYFHGFGNVLSFDPKFREVIVINGAKNEIYITDVAFQRTRTLNYVTALKESAIEWAKVNSNFIFNCGLEFHPDGKHFILSTREGFLAFERGTYKLNKKLSFPLVMQSHSHMNILRRGGIFA
jgi:hypothetical protein